MTTCDPAVVRGTRLRLWAEHLQLGEAEIDGDPSVVIDQWWRPIAVREHARRQAGAAPSRRLTLLPAVSRRTERLAGPLRGLLVDG